MKKTLLLSVKENFVMLGSSLSNVEWTLYYDTNTEYIKNYKVCELKYDNKSNSPLLTRYSTTSITNNETLRQCLSCQMANFTPKTI